jgi:hypothetical protein
MRVDTWWAIISYAAMDCHPTTNHQPPGSTRQTPYRNDHGAGE